MPVTFSRAILSSSFVVLIGLSSFVLPVLAQEPDTKAKVEEILKATRRGHALGPVAISPDGTLLAYTERAKDGWTVEVAPFSDPAKTTRVTASKKSGINCGESDVAWAPDSKRLAFSSDCQTDSQDNIFIAAISGDVAQGKAKVEVERLTEAKGEVGYPIFSPDGSKLAFLYVEGATRAAGALAAMKPWSGVIGEDGVEIQRVAMVDATAHKAVAPTFITPAALHAYEFDWSPDSKAVAYVAANPPGENNWWVAKLYTQALGGEPKVIFAPSDAEGAMHGLQMAVPRWSPDGKHIAFIGGLMSDQGSTGGDLWVVDAEGGEPVDWTRGRPTSAAWFTWANDHSFYISELAGGNSQLVKIDGAEPSSEKTAKTIYSFPGTAGDGRFELSLSSTSDHSTFVFTASSFSKPAEIYAAHATGTAASDLAGLQQLTHFNPDADGIVGKTESLTWKNDQFQVQGWLHLPKQYDPAKKYPMIVLVHGGPAAAAQSHWGAGGLNWTVFSAMGYFVLEPNPRGSYGQGEAFTAANRKDFGYGDLRDILAGVDTVLAKYPVDPDRIGLTGWSYGGFMTMFAVTQTNRFKAAYAGAGISNWQSYYGENSIDQWMTPYFGTSVYKDPAVYAKSSAINFIDKIKTPTLVVVGDRDGECPAPQSFEFWHALRDQHVPTQLVIYPNEGHGFVNPDHRTDVLVRGLNWFAKYMPAKN